MLKAFLKLFSGGAVNEADQQRALATLRLLRQDAVQSQLGMSTQQRAALERHIRESRKAARRQLGIAGRTSSDIEQAQRDALHLRTATGTMEAVVQNEVLTPRQLEGLRQIRLKRQGVLAFEDPEVVAALEMTREQCASVQTILRDYPVVERVADETPEAQRSRQVRRRQTLDRILATLNDAQKAKWAEISGTVVRRAGMGRARMGQRPPGARKRAARVARAARAGDASESGEG